jgi:hypothetical protein
MRTGLFPEARCAGNATGFLISVTMPPHPDEPELDSLYPRSVNGMYYRDWLDSLPGVIAVMDGERDGSYQFDLAVRSNQCPYTAEQFAVYVQETLNRSGFQW